LTSINTNTSASLAALALARNKRTMATALERLSTGLGINAAKDDAAGLAIAKKMAANVSGMQMGIRNLNDGISMIQTIEGAYQEAVNMVGRMQELAVQAATGTLTDTDRANLDAEYQSLKQGIQDIAKNTQWNGMNLIDGSSTQQNVQLHNGTSTQDININQLYGEPGRFDNRWQTNQDSTATPVIYAATGHTLYGDIQSGDVISMLVDGKYLAITLNADDAYYLKNGPPAVPPFRVFTDNNPRESQPKFEEGYSLSNLADMGATTVALTAELKKLTVLGLPLLPQNDGKTLTVNELKITRGDLKYLTNTSITDTSHSLTAMRRLDETLSLMTKTMSKLGSNISGLESSSNSLINGVVKLQQSQSRIEDADYAAETTTLVKTQIIAQASTAILTQANQRKQTVLALIK
jgi:flagellin